jgi:mRNA interferase RelE/StbE
VYKLLFHSKIEKQLSKIPGKNAKRLANRIRELRENPRPNQSRHLDREMYRLRDGDYRVIYAIFDDERVVYVGKIARRSEKTYKDINTLLAQSLQEVENWRSRNLEGAS